MNHLVSLHMKYASNGHALLGKGYLMKFTVRLKGLLLKNLPIYGIIFILLFKTNQSRLDLPHASEGH